MGAVIDCCNWRLEAATISEILHLFGQGNLPFIREKSGKSQGILKTDVCGNHALPTLPIVGPSLSYLLFCLQSWEKWMIRKLTGRSYGSHLKEKLRSYEIQLEILEEEEARLLRLIEERENKSLDAGAREE